MIIPNRCKRIDCSRNLLTKLVIPDKCDIIYCYNNQLKELIIPDGCEIVYCFNNQLKELIIPDGCEIVRADMKSVNVLNKLDNLDLWIWVVIIKRAMGKLLN